MGQVAIAIFLVILGGIATLMGIKLLLFRMRLSTWIKTDGLILEKQVDERKILPGTELDNYRVYIRYEYIVNGEKITGNRYNAIELLGGETAALKKIASKELEKIPDNINVYYDPQHPKESFINPISVFPLFISLFIGVPSLLAGILLFF